MKRLLVVLCVAAALAGFNAAPASATGIGLELTLLVDVSGSVDNAEFALQRTGYVNAFNDAFIHNLIVNAAGGNGIAARFMYWSGANQQAVMGQGWYHLTDGISSSAFATAINAFARPYDNVTAPGSAINYALNTAFNSPWFGVDTRKVFDVSGDGAQNDGANTFNAATAAYGLGVTVNGLAILGEAGLQTWYQNNIVTPGHGTLWIANDFGDFDAAVRSKIETEVSGVPEPGSMILLGTGLVLAARKVRGRRR